MSWWAVEDTWAQAHSKRAQAQNCTIGLNLKSKGIEHKSAQTHHNWDRAQRFHAQL
jgi:hypothetical protein